MVKKVIILIVIFTLCFSTLTLSATSHKLSYKPSEKAVQQGGVPPQNINEDFCISFITTVLQSQTQKAVNDYYSSFLNDNPFIQPWFTKIVSIERPYNYQFIMKFEVTPFVGAHNPVGRDHITFMVDYDGAVTLQKFEHLESYQIPEHKKDIIKKWPPK